MLSITCYNSTDKVESLERKTPQLRGVERESVSCRDETESGLERIIPSDSPLVKHPVPSSGKPTAERICVDNSLALDFKKRWVLLYKGTTPVQQSLHGAGNGDIKRAPSILPTGKEKGVRYSISKSGG